MFSFKFSASESNDSSNLSYRTNFSTPQPKLNTNDSHPLLHNQIPIGSNLQPYLDDQSSSPQFLPEIYDACVFLPYAEYRLTNTYFIDANANVRDKSKPQHAVVGTRFGFFVFDAQSKHPTKILFRAALENAFNNCHHDTQNKIMQSAFGPDVILPPFLIPNQMEQRQHTLSLCHAKPL